MVIDMELRTIATFLRIVELGNFTKVAAELGYVQSTISMQIQLLERELGFPLFDRIGKTVTLTQKGQEFLPYAIQIMQTLQQIQHLKNPSEPRGALRVGILESLFYWVFAPILPTFHTRLPGVSVATKTASGIELFSSLKRGELDIILLLDRKISEPNCVNRFIYPTNLVFVAPSDHKLASNDQLMLNEVLEYPMLLTERTSIYRIALEQVVSEKSLLLSPIVEVDNTGILINLIKNGMGISFLPEYAVVASIEQGDICTLPVEDCKIQFWIQIFTHKNKWITPQMEMFIELVKSHYDNKIT